MKSELLKLGLKQLIDDMDAGNTNITDEQCDEIFKIIQDCHPKAKYSYYKAARYLKKKRSSIDYYIQQG